MLPLYIESYEKLENKCTIDIFITINKMLSKLDDHKIFQINILENGEIFNGIGLEKEERREMCDLSDEIVEKIKVLEEEKNNNPDDQFKQEYLTAYISLLKYSNLLWPSEELILNFFFRQIYRFNKTFRPSVESELKFVLDERR